MARHEWVLADNSDLSLLHKIHHFGTQYTNQEPVTDRRRRSGLNPVEYIFSYDPNLKVKGWRKCRKCGYLIQKEILKKKGLPQEFADCNINIVRDVMNA
jgi:hypothetical protein